MKSSSAKTTSLKNRPSVGRLHLKKKVETGLWEDDFTFKVILPLTTRPNFTIKNSKTLFYKFVVKLTPFYKIPPKSGQSVLKTKETKGT